MSQHLTIAYLTNRRESKLKWFSQSIFRETQGNFENIKVVIVDFHAENEGVETMHYLNFAGVPGKVGFSRLRVKPKPSIWQGEHKLTKKDWFAASNARNTALCLAPDGWIAYVDDLSILMPGWLNCVKEAMAGNYIVLGAYKKVRKLVVMNGLPKSYEEFKEGIDSRWDSGADGPVPANGGMMYGCSVAMPVEALLTINGWPEDLCDGLGSEDYCCGLALENVGYKFKYDRRMLTLESEEDHHKEPAFIKQDWHFENDVPVVGGNGGNDKSHAALNIAKQSRHFPNSFGEGGIREVRNKVLAGEPFPIPKTPDRDWYSHLLLSEL